MAPVTAAGEGGGQDRSGGDLGRSKGDLDCSKGGRNLGIVSRSCRRNGGGRGRSCRGHDRGYRSGGWGTTRAAGAVGAAAGAARITARGRDKGGAEALAPPAKSNSAPPQLGGGVAGSIAGCLVGSNSGSDGSLREVGRSCAGVTRRFHKTTFRRFSRGFFTYALTPFLTNINVVRRT